MTTPKLQMPELSVGQAGKELTHNQALAILDQLAQAVVIDKDLTAPPGSPANGSMYIVAAGATGSWVGQSGKLAYWLTTVAAWTFITPADGWSVWVTDEAVRYERKAGAWTIAASGGGTAPGINKLINGNFQINQLSLSGTVTLAAGAYGHDGWKAGASGCTYTFAASGGVVTLTISAGSLIQVADAENLTTATHILSWGGTAQGKIGAGSYSASGVTASITGGANLNIEFNTGTLSRPQLEVGSVATPFEHRLYGQELALCTRYFQRINYASGCLMNPGQCISTSGIVYPLHYEQKRAVPTITISSLIVGLTANQSVAGGTLNVSLPSASNAVITLTGGAGLVAGDCSTLFANGAGQYIDISARL